MNKQFIMSPRVIPRCWLAGLLDLQEETVDVYEDYENEENWINVSEDEEAV